MRLRDYPYIVVRFACRECPRRGHYRLAALAERFGADAEMGDVLADISSSCSLRLKPSRDYWCQAYYRDLPPSRPPDAPLAVRHQRLRVVK